MNGSLLHFLPELLSGFMVNLEIAVGAVVIGLAIGLPLALLRLVAPRSRRIVWSGVRLMQAAPTYVVMYFVLNILPRDLSLFGLAITGLMAVTLAQSVYMTAYVAENGYRALEHLQRDEKDLALLFVPNVLRGWVVVVMSSGFGAAIGVSEAVGVTMRHAERMPAVGDRVALFVTVIGGFVVVFSAANWAINRLIRWLSVPKKLATVG